METYRHRYMKTYTQRDMGQSDTDIWRHTDTEIWRQSSFHTESMTLLGMFNMLAVSPLFIENLKIFLAYEDKTHLEESKRVYTGFFLDHHNLNICFFNYKDIEP